MKTIRRIMLLAMLLVAGMGAASAQNSQNPKQNQKQRLSREELAEKQARHIAESLALDDATAQRFIEVYGNCQKEVWTLRPQKARGERLQKEEKSDQAAGEELEAEFKRQQQMLDIRKKYYKEYSKFLTQKQIKRVYELEQQMKKRLFKPQQPGPKGNKRRIVR